MTSLKTACAELDGDTNLFNDCDITLGQYDGWASAELWDMSFGGATGQAAYIAANDCYDDSPDQAAWWDYAK